MVKCQQIFVVLSVLSLSFDLPSSIDPTSYYPHVYTQVAEQEEGYTFMFIDVQLSLSPHFVHVSHQHPYPFLTMTFQNLHHFFS